MISRMVIIISSLLLVALVILPSHAIDITLTGSWTKTIDASDLSSGPGSDLISSYESAVDQVNVDISNTLGGGDSWRVDVSKSDISWTSQITIYSKRTSDGSGGSVAGGTSYLEITDSDQEFFTGSDDVTSIDLQYKIDGISVQITPGTYSTSIVYTVVDT